MNFQKIGIATLLASCLVRSSVAEDQRAPVGRQPAVEKSAERYDRAAHSSAKSPGTAADAAGASEVVQNIVIDAGKSMMIDSAMDYSAVATVAVTVQCIICDSAAASLGTSGLVLQARWMVAGADLWVATENKAATAFPYWDAGGALFNVFGPQFRLILQNKGSQPIAVQQVTMFRRSQ